MLQACRRCGAPNHTPYCPAHEPASRPRWSANRDPAAHARFARAVKARDRACVDCGAVDDLRACHIVPVASGGSYDPDNGVTRCGFCDRLTDRCAR